MGVFLVLVTYLCRYLTPALLIKLNLGLKDLLSTALFVLLAFLAMAWDNGLAVQTLVNSITACYGTQECHEIFHSLGLIDASLSRTCNADNFLHQNLFYTELKAVQFDKALIFKNLLTGLNTGLKCLVPLVVVDLIFGILMTFGGLKMPNTRHLTMVAKIALLSLAAKQLM